MTEDNSDSIYIVSTDSGDRAKLTHTGSPANSFAFETDVFGDTVVCLGFELELDGPGPSPAPISISESFLFTFCCC